MTLVTTQLFCSFLFWESLCISIEDDIGIHVVMQREEIAKAPNIRAFKVSKWKWRFTSGISQTVETLRWPISDLCVQCSSWWLPGVASLTQELSDWRLGAGLRLEWSRRHQQDLCIVGEEGDYRTQEEKTTIHYFVPYNCLQPEFPSMFLRAGACSRANTPVPLVISSL